MIKRLTRILSLLALAVSCAWMLRYGMPALEKMTPSKTSIASTATPAHIPMLATASKSTHTASTAPASHTPAASMIPSTNTSIKAVVVPISLSVWAEPGIVTGVSPVAWLYMGAEVFIDECQHGWGWAHLAGGPGWVRSKWLDPDVCGGGKS